MAALISCLAGLLTLPALIVGSGVVIGLGVQVSPAAASSGCPGNQSLLPYSGNDPPYTCAQMDYSGKKSLDPWQTKTWSNTVPAGNPTPVYSALTTCEHPNDNDVTVTKATASSSYSATGTNWGSDQHSFGAGVLFTTTAVDSNYPPTPPPSGLTPQSYSKGCSGDDSAKKQGQIKNSISKVVQSLTLTGGYATGTVGSQVTTTAAISDGATGTTPIILELYVFGTQPTTPLACKDVAWPPSQTCVLSQGTISSGKATLPWVPLAPGTYTLLAAYGGDVSACPSNNDTCGFMPAQSIYYSSVISNPASPTTAALTSASVPNAGPSSAQPSSVAASLANFQVVTLTKDAVMPANPALSLTCPAGYALMYPETFNSGGFVPLVADAHSARVVPAPWLAGQDVSLQVTCRAANAPRIISGSLGFGTPANDGMTTTQDTQILFGGPGDDSLIVRNKSSLANGGIGNDKVIVNAPDGIGIGGPGDDTLISTTQGRSMLIGGEGHDVLIGSSTGETIMNAVDGQADDVVMCHSQLNKVIADVGDSVRGPCGTIIWVPR